MRSASSFVSKDSKPTYSTSLWRDLPLAILVGNWEDPVKKGTQMPATIRRIYFLIAALVMFVGSAALRAQPASSNIRIDVDASHAPQKILHSHLQIPVQPGALTLYYPEWIPGEHMPDGPIINVAGLKFTAGGKPVPWRRDLVDMFALHMNVPAGASILDVDLDFLLSAPASGFSSGASATV